MEEPEEFDFERTSANSELRYMTLELMKISIQKNKPFKEIATEFVENVYFMKLLLDRLEKDAANSKDSHEREYQTSNKPY